MQILTHRSTLHLVPVLYHDLSYLPHPFLTRHILLNVDTHPDTITHVLEACAIAPGQRRAGQTTLAHLQAHELATLAQTHQFQAVIDLQGQWLPGVEGADNNLRALQQTARYLQAALDTNNSYHRLQHLDKTDNALKPLTNQLNNDNSLLARLLTDTLQTWKTVTTDLRRATETTTIPNPFRSGNPLTPEDDQPIFRGRQALIQHIESLLADPQNNASLALLGPRRCGKTSLGKKCSCSIQNHTIHGSYG